MTSRKLPSFPLDRGVKCSSSYFIWNLRNRLNGAFWKKCLVRHQYLLWSRSLLLKRHEPFSSDVSIRPSFHRHLDCTLDISMLQHKFPYKMRVYICHIYVLLRVWFCCILQDLVTTKYGTHIHIIAAGNLSVRVAFHDVLPYRQG